MSRFLERYTNFDGIEVQGNPAERFNFKGKPEDWVLCPACHGHGSYNLELNAYGEGQHFRGGCNNCTGWGYVEVGSPDAKCVHKYGSSRNVGKCLTEYTCDLCGNKNVVDSSD